MNSMNKNQIAFFVIVAIFLGTFFGTYFAKRPETFETTPLNTASKLIDEAKGNAEQLKHAMDITQREVALDPKNLRARFLLGWGAQQRGLMDQALDNYKSMFPELKSVTWAARFNAGEISQAKGDLKGAEDHWMECIRVAPEQAIGWERLVRVLERQGKHEEAKEYFQSLKEIAPKSEMIPRLAAEFKF
jgi:tetratricopeptide (TPR) repeat protein